VVLDDGAPLTVRRFDNRWISVARGDTTYELNRETGNLTYAGSTTKDNASTVLIGSGQCKPAGGPAECVDYSPCNSLSFATRSCGSFMFLIRYSNSPRFSELLCHFVGAAVNIARDCGSKLHELANQKLVVRHSLGRSKMRSEVKRQQLCCVAKQAPR